MPSYNEKHKYKPIGFNNTKTLKDLSGFYISLLALNSLNIRTGVNHKPNHIGFT